jgi:hypothetical protein
LKDDLEVKRWEIGKGTVAEIPGGGGLCSESKFPQFPSVRKREIKGQKEAGIHAYFLPFSRVKSFKNSQKSKKFKPIFRLIPE